VSTVRSLGAELRLRGSAQFSRERLLPLAQFAVGGIGSVRGYRENAVLRDRGFAASAELRHPLFPSTEAGNSFTVLSFVDIGGGANTRGPWQFLSSVGVGASWQLPGLTADLVFAKRLNRLATSPSGDLQDRGIHFQLRQKLF
jgi:hemolysin activation/secretion protein